MRRLLYCLVMICAAPVGFGVSTPAQSPTKDCPKIIVNCPTSIPEIGATMTFTTNVKDAGAKVPLTYNWSISAGTITRGQGTSTITVDIGESDNITATVAVGGLNESCSNVASCSMFICRLNISRKFDEYGDIPLKDEKVRLDNFAIQLQNEPSAQGYVIAYDKRADDAQARATRAKDLMVSYYGIDPERIVTVDGGYRKSRQVELWIAPPGATPPMPTPEVPPDKAQTSKGAVKRN